MTFAFASFVGLDRSAARAFADSWLAAGPGTSPGGCSRSTRWTPSTGPRRPRRDRRQRVGRYFNRLLARFPDWRWRCIDVMPLEGGFLNLWTATIPVGQRIVSCEGAKLRNGSIVENRVFFDRTELMTALADESKAPADTTPR